MLPNVACLVPEQQGPRPRALAGGWRGLEVGMPGRPHSPQLECGKGWPAFRVCRAGAETQSLATPGWLAEQGPSVFTGTQRGAGAGAGPLEALPSSLHSGRTEALSPLTGSVEGGGALLPSANVIAGNRAAV